MDEIRRLIFEALGEASMCWSERPKGVFDSEQATKIGESLLASIQQRCIIAGKVTHIDSTSPPNTALTF